MSFTKRDNNLIVFKVLYFLVYFADATFSPFLPLYFISIGLSDVRKGIILGLIPIGFFLGNAFYSMFAKSFKNNIALLKIISLLEFIGVFIYGFISNYYALIALTMFLAFNNSSYFQIEDGACTIALNKHNKLFNSTRIFGSIGYASALLLGWLIVGRIPYSFLFIVSSLFFLMGFLILFFVYEYNDTFIRQETNKSQKGIMRNKNYVLYLLFYILLFGGTNIGNYVFPLFFNSVGIKDNTYSLFNSIRIACEIFVIVFYKRLLYLLKNYKNCLITSSVLFILSFFLTSIIKQPYLLIAINCILRGIAGGFIVIAGVEYVHALLGDSFVTKGLTTAIGVMNIFTGIGNYISPYVYNGLSFSWLFLILAIIQCLGFVFLLLIKDSDKAKKAT